MATVIIVATVPDYSDIESQVQSKLPDAVILAAATVEALIFFATMPECSNIDVQV